MHYSARILFCILFLLFCLLTAGCSGHPFSEPVIGNDWRSLRGYSSETYHFRGSDALISLMNSENWLAYRFYDAETGSMMGELDLDPTVWSVEDMDPDRLYSLYEQDFNEDGIYEFGVPMRDGLVLWYEFCPDRGFVFHGTGTADGPEEPFSEPAYATVYALDGQGFEVQLRFFEDSMDAGYYVMNRSADEIIGVLLVGESTGYAPDALDRTSEEPFAFRDWDGDGLDEIGLPLTDGSRLWFRYEPELEDFAIYTEECFAPEEEEAFVLLLDALGDRMNGMALSYTGVRKVQGRSCATFDYGRSGPDAFVAEQHFAVDSSGQIYVADGQNGLEYVPYLP